MQFPMHNGNLFSYKEKQNYKIKRKIMKLENIKQGNLDSEIHMSHILSHLWTPFLYVCSYVVLSVGRAHGVCDTTKETMRGRNV